MSSLLGAPAGPGGVGTLVMAVGWPWGPWRERTPRQIICYMACLGVNVGWVYVALILGFQEHKAMQEVHDPFVLEHRQATIT